MSGAPYVSVDTEFIREKTYWPTLCLIQLAYDGQSAAVDPLAPGIDLAPLLDLMDDAAVLKVFHSASQDMAVFHNLWGRLPSPIFDTQVAAMVCGHGEQPAYATLVSSITGVQLDKGAQMTDWSLRPLSDRQIEYALSDVTHLCTIYEQLSGQLEQTCRVSWLKEEMQSLTDEATYTVDPREQWQRIRIRRPRRRALAVLREVAAWREETAQHRNLPRNWVIRDEALAEIAANPPRNAEDLERVRGVQPRVAHGKDGAAIIAAVKQAMELPDEECPQLPPRQVPLEGHETMVALLQALLKLRCEAHGVAQKLVANRRDLDVIATSDNPQVMAMRGWRREIFGADALALKEGKLALTGSGAGVDAIRVSE